MPTEHPPGWTCKRTRQQVESYLLMTLELGDSLAVAEHIEACDWCAQHIVLCRLTLTARRRG